MGHPASGWQSEGNYDALVPLRGIEEGVAYRVGKLEIEGLDASHAAKVAEKLKLHSGDIYNSIYFALDSMIRSWSSGKKVVIEQTRNDENKTVDIRLQFQ